MRVEWHGQSAFTLTGAEETVFIDPFGDMAGARERGLAWDYPEIVADGIDLLLVTHEHADHNAVERIAGEPATLRSTAGTHESPVGEVTGIASEHDGAAGTERGPNTIFAFRLDGVRVAPLGDLGQPALRPEQRAALEGVDLLFVPVGGGFTIDGATAAAIARDIGAPWVVPMHYRTPRISFLETEEAFVAAMGDAQRLDSPSFDTADLERGTEPRVLIPATP
jgi:L-ascorbate metabolism protein UlaG (beta-lactamase superfamily)